jgi:Protein of unknown function (DUF5661)
MTFNELLVEIRLKHGADPDERFSPRELKMGMGIEKEHSDDPTIAKQITKAHLSEIPDYNTRLLRMERDAKRGMKKKGIKPEENENEEKFVPKSTEKRLKIQKGEE